MENLVRSNAKYRDLNEQSIKISDLSRTIKIEVGILLQLPNRSKALQVKFINTIQNNNIELSV